MSRHCAAHPMAEKNRERYDTIRRSLAIGRYQRFNDRTGLDDLGISAQSIKRSGGRPPKTPQSNEDIVELVYKQKWQAGKPFSNTYGGDLNECFVGVADAQSLSVTQVREKWSAVSPARRKAIESWLVALLKKHKKIHPSKKKKSQGFPPPK